MSEVETHSHPGRETNKISLTVRHGGNTITIEGNIHEKIKKILDEALRLFREQYGIQPPPNDVPYLRYGNTNLTDMDKSLQDYVIPDKAVLDLLFEHRGG